MSPGAMWMAMVDADSGAGKDVESELWFQVHLYLSVLSLISLPLFFF